MPFDKGKYDFICYLGDNTVNVSAMYDPGSPFSWPYEGHDAELNITRVCLYGSDVNLLEFLAEDALADLQEQCEDPDNWLEEE